MACDVSPVAMFFIDDYPKFKSRNSQMGGPGEQDCHLRQLSLQSLSRLQSKKRIMIPDSWDEEWFLAQFTRLMHIAQEWKFYILGIFLSWYFCSIWYYPNCVLLNLNMKTQQIFFYLTIICLCCNWSFLKYKFYRSIIFLKIQRVFSCS